MKFWLKRESTFIYLDQLLKAAGIFEDYEEIKDKINRAYISVNGSVETKRRKMLVEGDIVSFRDYHIKIVGSKEAKIQRIRKNASGVIKHGESLPNWTEFKVKNKNNKE